MSPWHRLLNAFLNVAHGALVKHKMGAEGSLNPQEPEGEDIFIFTTNLACNCATDEYTSLIIIMIIINKTSTLATLGNCHGVSPLR